MPPARSATRRWRSLTALFAAFRPSRSRSTGSPWFGDRWCGSARAIGAVARPYRLACEAFPVLLRYGGQYADVVPHLTVGRGGRRPAPGGGGSGPPAPAGRGHGDRGRPDGGPSPAVLAPSPAGGADLASFPWVPGSGAARVLWLLMRVPAGLGPRSAALLTQLLLPHVILGRSEAV